MQLTNGPNWLAARLQTANQQLAFLATTPLTKGARDRVESCQLELMGQTAIFEADVIGCLEQLQPVMASLKADQSVEATLAYAVIANTVYGHRGKAN
jgi:hypothetical protein